MKRRPTFFDLPLELRQLIYQELLPEGRFLCVNDKDYTEADSNLYQLRKVDPRLKTEIWAYCLKRRYARIVVSPDSWLPPSELRYDKLERIDIEVDYYRLDTSGLSYCLLRDQLRRLVEFLSRYKRLRNVTIRFRDTLGCYYDDWEPVPPPACWYETTWEHNEEEQTRWINECWMRTMSLENPRTIYWDLLCQLRDLPVCGMATVERLYHVSFPGDEYERMCAMANGMEDWLESDRKGRLQLVHEKSETEDEGEG